MVKNLNKGFSGYTLVVLEQGLRSITSFLLNIYLGKILSKTEFGEYTLLSSVLIFMLNIQSSLLLTPYLVLFNSDKDEEKTDLLTSVLMFSVLLFITFALFISSWSILEYFSSVESISDSRILLFFILYLFAYYFRDLNRTVFLASQQYKKMISFSLFSHLLIVFTVLFVRHFMTTNLKSFFSGVFFTSLLVLAVWYLKDLKTKIIRINSQSIKPTFLKIFEVGKWLLLRAILSFFSGGLILNLILVKTFSIKEVAEYGIYMIPVSLLNPFSNALYNYLIPSFSRKYETKPGDLKKTIRNIQTIIVGVLILFCIITMLLAKPLIRELFGNKYEIDTIILLAYLLQVCLLIIAIPDNAALVSLKNTKGSFFGEAIAASVVTCLGLFLVPTFGILGIGVVLCFARLSVLLYQRIMVAKQLYGY